MFLVSSPTTEAKQKTRETAVEATEGVGDGVLFSLCFFKETTPGL